MTTMASDPSAGVGERAFEPSWRRWARRALLAFVLLGAGYLGAVFALGRFLDPARLADWIQPRLAAVMNRDVEIGEAGVRLIPFEVQLRDIAVADPTGLAPELARVGTVGLRVELIPLLRREVRIARITVEEPELDLRVGPDGHSNFGDLSPESRDTPEQGRAPFSLELRSLGIDGGRVRYVSQPDSTVFEVTDLRGRSSVRHDAGGPWLFEGASSGVVSAQSVSVRGLPVELSFDVEAESDFQRLSVRNGALGADPVTFSIRGVVTDVREPVRTVALDLTLRDLPLDRAFELVPDSLRGSLVGGMAGALTAELRLEGEMGPGVRPQVTGMVSVSEGRVDGRGGTPLATGLAGTVELVADGSLRPQVQGSILGGAMSLAGSVTTGSAGAVDVHLRASPDLGGLRATVTLPEGVDVAGRLDADVRVAGPLRDPRRLLVTGDVRTAGVRGSHPGLGVPVLLSDTRVRLEGTSASFEDVGLTLGTERLTVSGVIRDLAAFAEPARTPWMEGSVRGPRLTLPQLRAVPLADTSLTYGRVAFAQAGGRAVKGRAPSDAAVEMGLERPESLPVAGRLDVRLDTLVDRRGSMEAVRALVEFGPGHLRVANATFRRYGGELESAFALSLGQDRDQPFSLSLRARNVDAGAFLGATTPLGGVVRGTLTLELDLGGTLDGLLLPAGPSLVGAGRYLVSGGGLRATPVTRELATFLGLDALREPTIRNWGTSFVLENGVFRLMDAVVDGAPGTPRVGGGVGVDGALDLLAAFDLPATRLDAAALNRLGVAGDIAARLRERDDVVQAVLRIGGSVVSPALRADPAAPARTLTQAVQEETRAEVRQRIEEQRQDLERRATGVLRGLLGRRDTTRISADTARVDSIRRDTIPPDTLVADTLRPDTVPRGPARRPPAG